MTVNGKTQNPSENTSSVQAIRNFIVEKGLRPGGKLPTHGELARELGMGIRRLREGLSVLRQRGLIETNRRGGTVVTAISASSLGEPIRWRLEELGCSAEDLMRARAAVESAAAYEAAMARKARDLLVLLDVMEQMEAAQSNSVKDDQYDESFHLAVLTATNNPALLTFGELIDGQFKRKIAEQLTETALKKSLKQHRVIFEAIEKREAELARQAMYEHIMGQMKDIKHTLSSKGNK